MSMSNNEKDEFIRKTLNADTFIATGEEAKEKIKKDVKISKIKQKKYTYGERRFMRFLAFVLIISVGTNVYLVENKVDFAGLFKQNKEQKVLQSVSIEDNIALNNIEQKTTKEDSISENKILSNEAVKNVVVSNTLSEKNDVVQSQISEKKHISVTEKGLDEELLKSELENYAITVGRYDDANDLEKNTIILLIANNFFNNNVTKSTGLDISASNKYAMTESNVHLFIKELIGVELDNPLSSYVNYMKYNAGSKFYSSGEKSTELKDEKYKISNLNVLSSNNNEYTLEGNLHRISKVKMVDKTKTWEEQIEADYTLNVTIVINEEYTYVPYLIKEYKAELKPGQEDNINRLVDLEVQNEQQNKR